MKTYDGYTAEEWKEWENSAKDDKEDTSKSKRASNASTKNKKSFESQIRGDAFHYVSGKRNKFCLVKRLVDKYRALSQHHSSFISLSDFASVLLFCCFAVLLSFKGPQGSGLHGLLLAVLLPPLDRRQQGRDRVILLTVGTAFVASLTARFKERLPIGSARRCGLRHQIGGLLRGVPGIKMGWILGTPIGKLRLQFRVFRIFLQADQPVGRGLARLRRELADRYHFGNLVGSSASMARSPCSSGPS